MSAVWTFLNGESAAWAAHEARACWQGALCIGLVWAVCRLGARRLPASVRGVLWWLACLRLLVGLVWFAPVSVPVLPASPSVSMGASNFSAKAALSRARPFAEGKPIPQALPPKLAAPDAALPPALPCPLAPMRPSGLLLLQAAWLLCIFCGLALAARAGLQQRRLRRDAVPVENTAVQGEFRRLSETLGLKRLPRLAQSEGLSTPCVSGLWRPTILLPLGLTGTVTPDELRLALAHELAHVRRGDLWLAWLPALTRGLFAFHPLAWLACREWATAREEACDAMALRLTGAAPACYGRLLLKIASQNPAVTLGQPALGLTAGYAALKRRLAGLTRLPSPDADRRWRRAAACLLVPILPLSIPWQLTARARVQPAATPEQSLPHYQITDLGVLDDQDSEAVSLNNAGQIVGNFHSTPRGLLAHAFVWQAGQTQPLDGLRRYQYTLANGINNQGQIIASSYNLYDHNRAFLWQDGAHRLGTLPGYRYSKALGLNDSGQIVGYAQSGDYDSRRALIARAFLWQKGRMTDLGTLGGEHSSAYAINNSGLVVGKADTLVPGQTHAFLWQNGQMTDLGTLGGANSLAARVNARGQIVGTAETEDARHAALWENGQPRDLGTLDGDTDSAANDINAQGLVVGSSEDVPTQSGPRAVLWQNSRALDLNGQLSYNPGWTLEAARAINDRGQIAGQGLLAGRAHAFLLTPLARK